ncbi:hypothetical protein [Flavobacterium sp.]|uniref:hypothetical protein n=1 Tax=Flavobacterium sp. TaxID=239 RepID=UPI0028BED35E|nr:hypothetical protein [Flavobacterium sp.]
MKSNSNENLIVVSEGKRPFWQTVIAAFLYTLCIGYLLYFCYLLFSRDFNYENLKITLGYFKDGVFILTLALSFSIVRTLYIDFEREKLMTEYSVGLIRHKRYSEIPLLEYVSVFKNTATENYEVNLWYKGNKHFNVCTFEDFQPAFDFGLHFSNRLNLDLLDATEKGNSKWIEK